MIENNLSKKATIAAAAISLAAALGIATPLVSKLEGDKPAAYYDTNKLPTICDGTTVYPDGTKVKMGDIRSPEECNIYMTKDLTTSIKVIQNSTTVQLSPYQLAGLGSFEYNVGAGNWMLSTVRKKINAGDVSGGCNQLMRWVFVGGRDCRLSRNNCGGIVARRVAEKNLCLRAS